MANQFAPVGLVSHATTPSSHASLAERDGCGCPPWSIRCAHWEGERLVLTDLALAAAGHLCLRRNYQGQFGWYDLNLLEGDYTACETCGVDGFMFRSSYKTKTRAMDSEADALAAFYAAEEALLRGAE